MELFSGILELFSGTMELFSGIMELFSDIPSGLKPIPSGLKPFETFLKNLNVNIVKDVTLEKIILQNITKPAKKRRKMKQLNNQCQI